MKSELMSTVLPQLPDERLQVLARGYSEASAAKRARVILFAIVLAGLTALSSVVAEVESQGVGRIRKEM